jgi:hypothetical protein
MVRRAGDNRMTHARATRRARLVTSTAFLVARVDDTSLASRHARQLDALRMGVDAISPATVVHSRTRQRATSPLVT